MRNYLRKIPDPLIRLVIVFGVFFGVILFIRGFIIPPELKETGIHRTSAIERELSKEIHYAGSGICAECHDEEYDLKNDGYHQKLSCEVCHGASLEHSEEPDEYTPTAPRERKFCPECHIYNPSRPTGFPQINPIAHNPLKACIECHDPHDPAPLETPRECSACHAQIAITKAESPHVMLDCKTCHDTPEDHKLTPRLIRAGKPVGRELCAGCHDNGSDEEEVPKIDVYTHGEKYVCWQCHYPHMPEVNHE